MSPVESPDLVQSTFTVRVGQLKAIDRVKAMMQASRNRSVSRSDVIQRALDIILPQIESDPDLVLQEEATA